MRTILFFSMLFIAPALAAESISFATDWKAQAEHGGFYQALAAGYYKEAGLDVTIRPGGPQSDIPRLMAAGAVDIAMASNAFQPFNLAAAGARVKVVMAAFQKDPQVLMLHEADQATGFDDLKERSIFIADGALATFWPWLKARFGYTDSQIRKYNYSLAPWLVNPGSVQEGYLTSEPFSARIAGMKPKVLLFADAGYPGYAAMIMARERYLGTNPAAVAAFVSASIRGWREYIYGDPSAANALIIKDNPEMTEDLISYSRAAMRDYGLIGRRDQIGCMTQNRWERFRSEMAAFGLIDPDVSVSDVVSFALLQGCDR